MKEGDRLWIDGQLVYFERYDEDGTPLVLCMDGQLRRVVEKNNPNELEDGGKPKIHD